MPLEISIYLSHTKSTTRRCITYPILTIILTYRSNHQESDAIMKKEHSRPEDEGKSESPSHLIDMKIKELLDWRGEMLARLRTLIKEADPEVVEEWKWRGIPVWSHAGIICTGETYTSVVKMTFAKGALLKDPSNLFNASLEGHTRRAIDFHEGDKINEKALTALFRAAVTLNANERRTRPARRKKVSKSI